MKGEPEKIIQFPPKELLKFLKNNEDGQEYHQTIKDLHYLFSYEEMEQLYN